ncbi:hypothetical protein F5544_05410 [Nocardia arthritidis]|uniref:Uncharacterized protein n=1 Tax=Nocardia arthritidis TaxID=228602 RepID=A0A6G9Y774_9NOCA|nr:hypothetical protein F5544_05410 [Nocardia arthritidis]
MADRQPVGARLFRPEQGGLHLSPRNADAGHSARRRARNEERHRDGQPPRPAAATAGRVREHRPAPRHADTRCGGTESGAPAGPCAGGQPHRATPRPPATQPTASHPDINGKNALDTPGGHQAAPNEHGDQAVRGDRTPAAAAPAAPAAHAENGARVADSSQAPADTGKAAETAKPIGADRTVASAPNEVGKQATPVDRIAKPIAAERNTQAPERPASRAGLSGSDAGNRSASVAAGQKDRPVLAAHAAAEADAAAPREHATLPENAVVQSDSRVVEPGSQVGDTGPRAAGPDHLIAEPDRTAVKPDSELRAVIPSSRRAEPTLHVAETDSAGNLIAKDRAAPAEERAILSNDRDPESGSRGIDPGRHQQPGEPGQNHGDSGRRGSEPARHGDPAARRAGMPREPELVGAAREPIHGTASNVGEFRGDARPEAAAHLTPEEVRREIADNKSLIMPERCTWDPERQAFRMRAGNQDITVSVRVADEPLPHEVARFSGEGTEFHVEISPTARTEDVARAVAHELAEIKLAGDPRVRTDPFSERPNEMSSHLGGRFAELKVLEGQLDRAGTEPARAHELPRLRRDLTDLMNRLGLKREAEYADRWKLLREHDPELATRLEHALDRDGPPGQEHDHDAHPDEIPQHTGEFESGERGSGIDFGSAIAFRNELYDAARVETAGSGRSPQDAVQQFAIHRALSRIFKQSPDGWVLKGGQGMLSRIPGARMSSDIDLVRSDSARKLGLGDPDFPKTERAAREADLQDEMIADYCAALERDHGDNLRFVFESKEILQSGGLRIFHRVFVGDIQVMRLGADLNPERKIPMHVDPEIVPFPDQLLRTDAMGTEPNLRVLSVADTLAHKLAGMHTEGFRSEDDKCLDCLPSKTRQGFFECRKAGSTLPYRPQDMADVLLLAMHNEFDGEATKQMLEREFDYRRSGGDLLALTGTGFELPNKDWGDWFEQHLRTTDALPFRTLDEAMPLAHSFLDPLLRDGEFHGQWDPAQRRWIGEHDQPLTETHIPTSESTDQPVPEPRQRPANVRPIEGTGAGAPSTHFADAEHMGRWDALAGRGKSDESLRFYLDRMAANHLPAGDKVKSMYQYLERLGYQPEEVAGLDDKHLRFYVHQSGEEYIHTLALLADPGTTVEIVYTPTRHFEALRGEAYQGHIAYVGELPKGMTLEQANTVAYARWTRGESIHDIPHHEMVRELLELHAKPLKSALAIRDRLIERGIDPSRIRLAYTESGRDHVYSESRWQRAHIFTLARLREDPVGTRQLIVDGLRGAGEAGEIRAARAENMVNEVLSRHEPGDTGPGKYTLLWIRDSRPGGMHGPELDTRPAYIRQMIEMLRERQPDRKILLVGDDLFAGRPELRESWERAGVLDGVDTNTLIKFWERDGLSRAEQGLFFHRFGTEREVVQIGMESGALETQTVLGVPTVYNSALEYEGTKANRWLHYSQRWEYGHTVRITDEHGNQVYDPQTRRPLKEFQPHGPALDPPLRTIERVTVGPELPDPTSRPVAVMRASKVSVTADRITRLIDTGELDQWSQRLGRSTGPKSHEWGEPWTEKDWRSSAHYADQLTRWLHTEARTPDEIATKWDAIRLALQGVVEPGFSRDDTDFSTRMTHPFFTLHTDNDAPVHLTNRLAEGYAAEPEARPAAVAAALREVFETADVRGQGVRDLSAFRMEPEELEKLHQALDRVISRNQIHPPVPYDAPPGGSAWDAPGASTHSRIPPLDRLEITDDRMRYVLEGDDTGRGGGHRFGTGVPNKTEFPERWDDETIRRYVLEIAAAPDRALFQANGNWNVIGWRDGVQVSVIIKQNGQVQSTWPEKGRGVHRNPPAKS